MSQYSYPVKYFSGPGVHVYSAEGFRRKVQFLDNLINCNAPIIGETGLDGVLLDFNYGLRLQIPEGNWHVRITDAESDYVFIDEDISAVTLISFEKFFVEWEIALWLDGELVFYHQFDPTEQKVHFNFPNKTLGDTIAFLPYVEAFRQKYNCEVTCRVNKIFREIVQNYYPKVAVTEYLPADCYACYQMFVPVNLSLATTEDGLLVPLRRVGHAILRRIETPPKTLFTPTKPRSIGKKYVCIGVQASTPAKCWLNPNGWDEVVKYLKSIGYRVLCIDKERKFSQYGMTVKMPKGAEDFSGKYNLMDRINQLAYADFFIGVSSGLSWLAWSVDIPVVMISGLTEPWYEFDTPYRINNQIFCHGCYNECRDLEMAWHCARFEGTPRMFECSKGISARQVIKAIDRLIADRNLEARHGNL